MQPDTPSLFNQFQARYQDKALPEYDQRIILDGIIDEARFASQTVKLLVIAKEHNTQATDEQDPEFAADYRVWGNRHVYLQFAHRISEWAFGLQNGFAADFDSITYEQKHEALRSIAFMNVKKTTGGATSSKPLIMDYIRETKDLLLQQITEINPNLILCCFRYNEYVNALFDIRMGVASDGKCGIGEWNGVKVINFFHPSSRKNKRLLYETLKQATAQ